VTEPVKLDFFTSSPLLYVLKQLRDLGRSRKESGDEELLAVARRAHNALAWFECDSEGRFIDAERFLDEVYNDRPARESSDNLGSEG
jgi:hypothetical protein